VRTLVEKTFPSVSGPPGNAAAFQARAILLFPDGKTPQRIFIARFQARAVSSFR